MNENRETSFAAVLAAELQQIALRRDCAADGYPIPDLASAQEAWQKAQEVKEATRQQRLNELGAASWETLSKEQQHAVEKYEEEAFRTAWVVGWEQAELRRREQLQAAHKAELEATQERLGAAGLSTEERQPLEREAAIVQKKLEQATEIWTQERAERIRRREKNKEALEAAKQIQEERAKLADPRKEPVKDEPTKPETGQQQAAETAKKAGQALLKREESFLKEQRNAALRMELVGLAFSGGGIRSATFNLGLLQGLADLELLRFVDYLSTVSGGGYIGSWLAAWIHRGKGLAQVIQQLCTRQGAPGTPNSLTASSNFVEPPPIRHLRRHSNYLAPRQGFLSADVWVLWATYLRNFLLNQLVLLPATILVLLVVRIVMLLYYPWSHNVDEPNRTSILWMTVLSLVTGVLWFLVLTVLFRSSFDIVPQEGAGAKEVKRLTPNWLLRLSLLLLIGAVLLCSISPYPLLLVDPREDPSKLEALLLWQNMVWAGVAVAGVSFLLLTVFTGSATRGAAKWLATAFLGAGLVGGAVGYVLFALFQLLLVLCKVQEHSAHRMEWMDLVLSCAAFALPCAALAGLAFLLAVLHRWSTVSMPWSRAVKAYGAVFFSGLIGGALLYGVYRLLHGLYHWDGMQPMDYVHIRATALVMTLGPPLLLLALVLAIYAGVGLSKGQLKESLREWWSSVCARLLAIAAVWLAITVVALYATPLVLWAGPGVGTFLGSGWLVTVAGGVLAGKGRATGSRQPVNPYLEWTARIAPYVFVIGLVLGVSLLLHVFLDCPPRWWEADDKVWIRQLVPHRAPNRVLLSRTQKENTPNVRHERQDITERSEVIDDSFIVQEMYWLGILNTDRHFVPHLDYYLLTKEDKTQLKKRHHFPDAVLKALDPLLWHREDDLAVAGAGLRATPLGPGPLLAVTSLAPESSKLAFPVQSEELFDEKLDKVLSPDTPYTTRAMIVQHAKKVEWMYEEEDWKQRLIRKLGFWLFVFGALLVLAMWGVDVNLFSLHAVYGNRLIRAYLGASRTQPSSDSAAPRNPDPITGLDHRDNLPLSRLAFYPYGRQPDQQGYDGPYPLINTALNLVHGEEPAWQERKAEAFLFSPLYCGSETTGYRPTSEAYSANVSLGNVVTLSGAAASPNMGYHSSPAVTVLLTAFNARLGAWVGNPKNRELWQRRGPWFGFWYLFRELFGLTNDTDGYVYLSDGGHFENLGVYELVRRRCRYIIVSDAGQDADHAFEDLGNLIRKCRIDFGIRIEIDLTSVRLQGDARRCRWHCAIGKVRYDDVDAHAAPGTLVYIKPSLTGDEPADVLNYAGSHFTFPHESTGNQFYNESQLESYRALGHHIAHAVFEQSVNDLHEENAPDVELPSATCRRECRTLFASVVRRWFDMPPELEKGFLHSTREFIAIQEAFRNDERLWWLTFDLYPEYEPSQQTLDNLQRAETEEEKAARQRAELHAVTHMLQVMENAWLSLNLDVNYAHPMSRGWMDVFHRWASAETVRTLWPVLRAEFARGFVSFCEKQMRLGVVEGNPIRLQQVQLTAWHQRRLCVEFEDQWPEAKPQIEDRLRLANARPNHWVWLIYMNNPYPGHDNVPPSGMPCGIIHLSRDGEANQNDGGALYDFFVWMRGAYRNTGLGRTAVESVLNNLPTGVTRPFRLRVRLPVEDLTGPGGKLQKAMWLTFYHHLDFVRVDPVVSSEGDGDISAPSEIVLERSFEKPASLR